MIQYQKQKDKWKKELDDLQKVYDLAMKENNRLRAKRKYWGNVLKN